MTLHLIRLPVDLPALAHAAQDRGWTRGRRTTFDEGAALHHLLGETFGPGVLQPFRLMVAPRARRGRVYAYTATLPDALRETAAMASMPEVDLAFAPGLLQAKTMPNIATPDRRVGFDLRLRPVVRLAKDFAAPADRIAERRHGFRKGAEIDAFLAEALSCSDKGAMESEDRTREVVYRDWLAARLGHAADLNEVRLAAFRRTVTLRDGHALEGPDAVVHGTLTIRDTDAFADLLRRGVGRHKAYGYGMLLLRPPRSPVPRR